MTEHVGDTLFPFIKLKPNKFDGQLRKGVTIERKLFLFCNNLKGKKTFHFEYLSKMYLEVVNMVKLCSVSHEITENVPLPIYVFCMNNG